jgi:hypothetical protein
LRFFAILSQTPFQQIVFRLLYRKGLALFIFFYIPELPQTRYFAAQKSLTALPSGVREPQWLGTKYTTRRKGEVMKGG